jgi:hypothetical protein
MVVMVYHAVKKGKKISLIYKESRKGSGAKSYLRKGFLINEEMRKYLPSKLLTSTVTHNFDRGSQRM